MKRTRLKWEDNIKVHLKGMGWEDVEWIIWLRIERSCRMFLRH
jgi:hypothetical protein